MNVWADILLGGITIGALYVLVGHGFNIVYLTSRTFNFAQGQFVAAGGLLAYGLIASGYPVAAILLVIPAVGLLGVIEEKIAVSPILKRPDSEVWIVSTLGASVAIQGMLAVWFGQEPLQLALPHVEDIVVLGGTRQTVGGYVLLAVSAVVTVALLAITRYTWIGKALLAAAEDPSAARGLGINTAFMMTASFAVAAALGALAGIVAAPVTFARADLGSSLLVQVFIVLAIGGFGSTTGLLVVGLSLGMAEAAIRYLLGGEYVMVIVFAALLTSLLVQPRGLFAPPAQRSV